MSRGRKSEVVGVQLQYVLCIVLAFHLQLNKCFSLNLEGLALMEFRSKVEYDPQGVLENWNPKEDDPCKWSGVHCISGKVDALNLNGMSLKGMLVPELGNLVYLRTLSLCNNNFSGVIPKEIGKLTMLELLDLGRNNLSGTVPIEISEIPSLGSLFLCHNRLEGVIRLQLARLNMVSNLEAYKDSSRRDKHGNNIETTSHMFVDEEGLENIHRRRLFKVASNLRSNPLTSKPVPDSIGMLSIGSGSFPAIPTATDRQQSPPPAVSPNTPSSESPTTSAGLKVISTTSTTFKENPSIFAEVLEKWPYLVVIVSVVFIILLAATFTLVSRSRGMATISQWPSHLSGQLRRAFIAGITKLNRDELEAACEEFSNIIHSYPDCTVYKGTLSDGVEIAVVATVVSTSKDWSTRSESRFRQKLDTLSRVNHKNFVNLLGYCKENEPFTRMMVFEFASGGTLDEHLHGMEHLDWRARMRIIMGVAYYLEYIHHQLKPPVAHNNLRSATVLLTDDYAAKVVELDFWKDLVSRRTSNNQSQDNPALPPSDTKGNVYSFGILLLEIISGRPAYTREQGSIVKWASDSMNGNQTVGSLIDPRIDNFGSEELDIIYEVSQECVNPNPRMRPSMKDVTAKLRKVLGISPEAAVPRLSPLWWAELEILTVEAS